MFAKTVWSTGVRSNVATRGFLSSSTRWKISIASTRPRNGARQPAHSSAFTKWEFSTTGATRSEEHTSELQSQSNLVCRLLLEKKKQKKQDVRHYIHIIFYHNIH